MAKDSLKKASTPEPFSASKTSNWVARGGGLPAYVQHIAHDLMEKRGLSESRAIQMAIGIVKRWARGGGNVDANTRAAASKAVAEWEKLKAGAKAKKAVKAAAGDEDDFEVDDDDPALEEFSDYAPPVLDEDVLAGVDFEPDELVREAATAAPMSNAKRRPGESLGAWGKRLKSGDASLAAAAKTRSGSKSSSGGAKTRGGSSQAFDDLHPRGRGGEWTIKGGDTSPAAKAAARKMGVGDGKLTTEAIRAFQRRHGLTVDGVIGKQTASALLGNYKGAKDVAVGNLKEEQVQKLTGKRGKRVRQSAEIEQDLAVLEAVEIPDVDEFRRVLEAVGKSDGDGNDAEGAGDVDPVFCVKCRKKVKPTKKKNCPTCGTNLGPAVAKARKAAA